MPTKHLMVYGTLRSGERAHGVLAKATKVKEAVLPGFKMVNLGGFPGIVEDTTNKKGVIGEVFEVDEGTITGFIDFYEGFNPDRPADSHYVRKEIPIGGIPTQVYVYNHPTDGYPVIPSGNWKDR